MPEVISLKSELGVWQQNIEYESIPFAYFHCKKSGHWAKKCPTLIFSQKKSKKICIYKGTKDIVAVEKINSMEGPLQQDLRNVKETLESMICYHKVTSLMTTIEEMKNQ